MGVLYKSPDYRLYFRRVFILILYMRKSFLVPSYYQPVYRVYLLLSYPTGKSLAYSNTISFSSWSGE